MAEIVVIPQVKISGQGITLYDRLEGYIRSSSVNGSLRQIFCAFHDHKPKLYFDNKNSKRIFTCNDFRQKNNSVLPANSCQLCSVCVYKNEYQEKVQTKNTPEILDKRSVANLKNAIYAMLWLTGSKYNLGTKIATYPKKKLTFATLTLPSEQLHSDTFIKSELLNQFFNEFREKKSDLLYIWRSEKQKNGNVHFHILLNCFYNFLTLQHTWNRILDKHDYVKNYTAKFNRMTFNEYASNCKWNSEPEYQELLRRYRKGQNEGWKNPNTTDIDFLHAVENVPGYLVKEMTKKNNNESSAVSDGKWKFQATGKAWSCSQEITAKSAYSGDIPDIIYHELSQLYKTIPNKKFENQYITHYSLSPDLFLEYNLPKCFDFYIDFLKS